MFRERLDFEEREEARQMGDALRVGNEPDVRDHLSQVLCDPNAIAIIHRADQIATEHAPWDAHGPFGEGVDTLRVDRDGAVDLVDRATGCATYLDRLDPAYCMGGPVPPYYGGGAYYGDGAYYGGGFYNTRPYYGGAGVMAAMGTAALEGAGLAVGATAARGAMRGLGAILSGGHGRRRL